MGIIRIENNLSNVTEFLFLFILLWGVDVNLFQFLEWPCSTSFRRSRFQYTPMGSFNGFGSWSSSLEWLFPFRALQAVAQCDLSRVLTWIFPRSRSGCGPYHQILIRPTGFLIRVTLSVLWLVVFLVLFSIWPAPHCPLVHSPNSYLLMQKLSAKLFWYIY